MRSITSLFVGKTPGENSLMLLKVCPLGKLVSLYQLGFLFPYFAVKRQVRTIFITVLHYQRPGFAMPENIKCINWTFYYTSCMLHYQLSFRLLSK